MRKAEAPPNEFYANREALWTDVDIAQLRYTTFVNEDNRNQTVKIPIPRALYLAPGEVEPRWEYADNIAKNYGCDNFPSTGTVPVSSVMFNQINAQLIDNTFLGYGEMALLAQNPIITRICSSMADAMTDKWIEFISVSDDTDETDNILELEDAFETFGVKALFKRCIYYALLMGGVQLYPKIKGDERNEERENPLILDSTKIGKGDLEYFQIIEPTWYVPIKFDTMNPFSDWFYKAEYYTTLGRITHESRMFKFMWLEAPNILRPTYMFNGFPMAQQCIPYIQPFEQMLKSIPQMVDRLNLAVLKTAMQTLPANPGTPNNMTVSARTSNRIQALNILRNNTGTFVIDKDEEFEQVNLTLVGVKDIMSQFAEFLCIVPAMPAVTLLGQSLQGFNASGEFELKTYHERVGSLQEHMGRPNLIKTMHLIMLTTWGKINKNITFKFRELGEIDEVEAAQIKYTNAQTADLYIQNQVITNKDEADRLTADPESGYDNLNTKEVRFDNMQTERMKPTGAIGGKQDKDDMIVADA